MKSISSQIQINTLFKTNYEIKRRRCDRSIQKAMRIPADIHQANKKSSLLQFNQKMPVDRNLQIIYGYHFLTNHSLTLYFLQ